MTGKLWLPRTIRKPLPIDPARDPKIHPVGAVFHIAVSEAESLFGDFKHRTDGIESTGYIRRQGASEQYRPLDVECDAQAAGNSWERDGTRYGFTSWESQGMGPGAWSDFQVSEIQRVILFHRDEWGAPMRTAPAFNAPGFGYHRLYDEWNPHGHSCPGDERVAQWHDEIVPWMASHANPHHQSRIESARVLLVKAQHATTKHARIQHLERARELLVAARDDKATEPHRHRRISQALELLTGAERAVRAGQAHPQTHIAKVLAALPIR
jgi:hypothetical protein